jgi:hypothetical protein
MEFAGRGEAPFPVAELGAGHRQRQVVQPDSGFLEEGLPDGGSGRLDR